MTKTWKVLIGGAPSSGSTALADLLDSSSSSICGPELGLFALNRLYTDFKNFRVTEITRTPSAHSSSVGLYTKFLCKYGLTISELQDLISNSSDASNFFESFSNYYRAFRGRPDARIFFEKTPQNVYAVDHFLHHISDSFFVFTTRNPSSVIKSLVGRGYSPYAALLSWLTSVAKIWPLLESDLVAVARYEDVMDRPFEWTSEFLATKDINIESQQIEQFLKVNSYRLVSESRLKSWNARTLAFTSQSSRDNQFDDVVKVFWDKPLDSRFCAATGLAEIALKDAAVALGYDEIYEGPISKSNIKLSRRSIRASQRTLEKKSMLSKYWHYRAWKQSVLPMSFVNPL